MAYSTQLAGRVRDAVAGSDRPTERKMFGGVVFLLNGNMCCGVLGEDLMLRLGAAGVVQALEAPHTRVMDFTGKPLKTMVYVSAEGVASDQDLKRWLNQAIAFTKKLPPK